MSSLNLFQDGSTRVHCCECDWEGEHDEVKIIKDFEERVAPGEECPAGECSDCGTLVHNVSTTGKSIPAVDNLYEACRLDPHQPCAQDVQGFVNQGPNSALRMMERHTILETKIEGKTITPFFETTHRKSSSVRKEGIITNPI